MTDSHAEVKKIFPSESEVSREFWEGCRAQQLRLQHCAACDEYQFYPRIVCSCCGGKKLTWRSVSGRGRVASFTIVRRGISPAYPVPYVVALIRLEQGPCMMSHVVDSDPEKINVGDEVNVAFQSWGEGHVLPVFQITQ